MKILPCREDRAMTAVEVFSDRQRLFEAAAEHVVRLCVGAVAENGIFTVALSGGSTPRPLYALLASDAFTTRIDWSRVHLFWGDERCIPPVDPRSNYRMARESLLDAVPLPPGNIHRIRGEDDPILAAAAYEQELRDFFGSNVAGRPPSEGFDLILLGMGDNGHTASLFPGMPAVTEQARWVMAQDVADVSMWRITLTPVVINAAKHVTFIVSGAGKAERLREVLEGTVKPEVLPAQMIRPVHGKLLWLVDKAAAALMNRRDQ